MFYLLLYTVEASHHHHLFSQKTSFLKSAVTNPNVTALEEALLSPQIKTRHVKRFPS